MSDASKPRVRLVEGARPDGPVVPRRYTLTHSDMTGDLFLTIGPDFDREALSALQVRLERDEVLAEWVVADEGPRLELLMAAQGGLPVFGTGRMRCEIFRHYRPMVLSAMHWANRALVEAHPELDEAPVIARFVWRRREDVEPWGKFGDYRPGALADDSADGDSERADRPAGQDDELDPHGEATRSDRGLEIL